MLNVDKIVKTYSGKIGCMCGCNGEYKDSERARKLAITQLLNNPAVKFDAWADDSEGCLYVVTATRNRVLYLNGAGVRAVRAMGFKEEA